MIGTFHNARVGRRGVALALVTGVALALAACSAAAPEASTSPSASPSLMPVATDVPLEEQLFDALRAGDAERTTAVLEAGADVDAPLADSARAIDIALVRNDPGLVAAVLAAQPDLTAPDAQGMPLLNAACKRGVSGEVAALLIGAGASVDSPSPDDVGSLPIHECAYSGSLEAIDELLAAGVDVNALQTSYGGTALIVAAWQDHVDLVSHLLDVGADPTIAATDGSTARKWALVAGDQQLADLLATVGG